MSARNALKTLTKMRLRIGRLSDLNDPFDSSYHIVGAGEKHQALVEAAMKEVNEFRNGQIGILCFSRTWSEPLLWSHYADAHKGICIVLRQPVHESVFRVQYSNTRAPVALKDIVNASGERRALAAAMSAYKIKSVSWRRERETRILVSLKKCQQEAGSYFTPLPTGALFGLILGLHCKVPVARIRRMFRKLELPKAKLWVVKKGPSGIALERVAI